MASAMRDGAGDAVEDRQAELVGEGGGEVGHAGAAEHDGLGAVLVDGERGSRAAILRAASRVALLEVEDRDVGGADAGAAVARP